MGATEALDEAAPRHAGRAASKIVDGFEEGQQT